MQKQQKSLKIKSYSRTFITLDLSNFEILCSAELSMKKVLLSQVLRRKSVTKKEMNKCMAAIKYMILAGFEPGPPG